MFPSLSFSRCPRCRRTLNIFSPTADPEAPAGGGGSQCRDSLLLASADLLMFRSSLTFRLLYSSRFSLLFCIVASSSPVSHLNVFRFPPGLQTQPTLPWTVEQPITLRRSSLSSTSAEFPDSLVSSCSIMSTRHSAPRGYKGPGHALPTHATSLHNYWPIALGLVTGEKSCHSDEVILLSGTLFGYCIQAFVTDIGFATASLLRLASSQFNPWCLATSKNPPPNIPCLSPGLAWIRAP
jgi:hypothetical protein